MNLALFGVFDRRPLGPGWTTAPFVAVLGGDEADLTELPPEGRGTRRVVAGHGGGELHEPKPGAA